MAKKFAFKSYGWDNAYGDTYPVRPAHSIENKKTRAKLEEDGYKYYGKHDDVHHYETPHGSVAPTTFLETRASSQDEAAAKFRAARSSRKVDDSGRLN